MTAPVTTAAQHWETGARPPQILLILSLIGFAGAAWSLLFEAGSAADCRACGKASEIVAGLSLVYPAMALYAIMTLLAVIWLREPNAKNAWPGFLCRLGFVAAAGVHLTLVALLFHYRALCWPCLLTTSAGLLGAVVTVMSDRTYLRRALVVVAVVAVATWGGVRVVREVRGDRQTRLARQLESQVLREPKPLAGTAKLVVFEREGCEACRLFRDEVLVPLQTANGRRLQIDERPAPKGIPTPTVVIIGRTHKLFVGNPGEPAVREAISSALETTPSLGRG